MKGNYYYFAPLLNEKGEQVVRRAKTGEYIPTESIINFAPPISRVDYPSAKEYPILTMKKFDHDPFERIRKVYDANKGKGILNIDRKEIWDAISETIKELEGK